VCLEGRHDRPRAGPARRRAGTAEAQGARQPGAVDAVGSSLGTSIANVALPTLGGTRSAPPFQAVQWIVLAYLLAITSTLIVSVGRLGDLPRPPAAARWPGSRLFTMASLLCGLAPALVAADRRPRAAGPRRRDP
jgi:MFS family permease